MWVAAPTMVLLLYATGGRLTVAGLRRSIWGGLLFAGQIGLFFAAVQQTSVVNAQLINAMQPALVLLVAGRMFGERVTKNDVAWTAVAFAGVAVVLISSSGQPEVSGWGDLLAFGNLILWTVYFLEVKRVRRDGMGAIEYMTGVMLIAAIVFTPYALLTSNDLGSLHGSEWLWIAFIVLVPGAGGHVVMGWAHKYVDVSVSSLMTLGVPVVSAVAAWWLLDEGMSAGQLVGGAIVLGSARRDRRPASQPRAGRGRARADLRGLPAQAKGAAMQRLSGLDASFLYLETPSAYMHVAGLMILDPSTAPVEWSFDEVRDMYAQRLHLAPPFRRRLVEVPFGVHHPVWIEDPDFDLDFHLHHIAVPPPGGARQLATLGRGDRGPPTRPGEAALGGLGHRGARARVHRRAHQDAPRRHRRSVGQRDDGRDARHRARGP